MEGAGVGHIRILSQGDGANPLFYRGCEPCVIVMGKIGHIQLTHNIRADLLMKIQPLAVLQHKVRAVTLPKHIAVGILMAIEPAEDHTRRNEAAPGGLSIIRHLDHIGKQGVHRCLHQRPGVVAADFGIDFLDVQRVLHGHIVIGRNGATPDLRPAPHPAKNVAPGAPVVLAPNGSPLAGGIRPAMKIGVHGLYIFHFLAGSGIGDPLVQAQMVFSHDSTASL